MDGAPESLDSGFFVLLKETDNLTTYSSTTYQDILGITMGMPVKENGETALYVVGVYKYDTLNDVISSINLGKSEIENIYVLPEYRKNKIGTAILHEILQELKARKYDNVNCLADEATDFYEKYGFTKGKDFVWMDIALSDRFKRG